MAHIGDLAQVDAGFQFRGRVEPDASGNVAVIQVKDLKDGVLPDAAQLVSVRIERGIDAYRVGAGDVLFLSRGPRLFAVAIDDIKGDVIVPNYFYILRPKPSVLPHYIAWAINSPKAQAQLKLVHTGTHMPIVAKSDFLEIEIDLPPLQVQRAIVALDTLARREQRLLSELIKIRQQLIEHICVHAASGQAQKGK